MGGHTAAPSEHYQVNTYRTETAAHVVEVVVVVLLGELALALEVLLLVVHPLAHRRERQVHAALDLARETHRVLDDGVHAVLRRAGRVAADAIVDPQQLVEAVHRAPHLPHELGEHVAVHCTPPGRASLRVTRGVGRERMRAQQRSVPRAMCGLRLMGMPSSSLMSSLRKELSTSGRRSSGSTSAGTAEPSGKRLCSTLPKASPSCASHSTLAVPFFVRLRSAALRVACRCMVWSRFMLPVKCSVPHCILEVCRARTDRGFRDSLELCGSVPASKVRCKR